MLGWGVHVYRGLAGNPSTRIRVARWRTGIFGLTWIDDLVKTGKAMDLGGSGYPSRYSMPAGVFLSVISKGLPPTESPAVIGDDYVLPSGWNGEIEVDVAALSECGNEEELLIEAWDQS